MIISMENEKWMTKFNLHKCIQNLYLQVCTVQQNIGTKNTRIINSTISLAIIYSSWQLITNHSNLKLHLETSQRQLMTCKIVWLLTWRVNYTEASLFKVY